MVVDMDCFRPRTLSDIALEKVVKLSLMKVIDITNRDSEWMRQGSVKRKRGVNHKFDTLHSVVRTVQNCPCHPISLDK